MTNKTPTLEDLTERYQQRLATITAASQKLTDQMNALEAAVLKCRVDLAAALAGISNEPAEPGTRRPHPEAMGYVRGDVFWPAHEFLYTPTDAAPVRPARSLEVAHGWVCIRQFFNREDARDGGFAMDKPVMFL